MRLAVDVCLFWKDVTKWRVLLVKRKYSPFDGTYALPGGIVLETEELLNAALRELKDETGVAHVRLQQLGVFDDVSRDPRERIISVAFYGLVDAYVKYKEGDDVTDVRWFDVKDVPSLAFDHNDIIHVAVQQLHYDGMTGAKPAKRYDILRRKLDVVKR